MSVIKPGTKVIYADIADATGAMNVDITLSTGHGPVGYGHVTLAAPGDHGTVTIDGGTGRYRHFYATAAVTCPDICYWDGTYRFDRDEHDD